MPGIRSRFGALAAADFALHANWGTGPTTTVEAGSTDEAGRVSITAGTTPGANPTITLTFKQSGARDAGPAKVVCSRGDIVAPTTGVFVVSGKTTDTEDRGTRTTVITFTFIGTPVAASVYVLDYAVVFLD